MTALRGYFRQHFPSSSPSHILVAFSGGIDSACLLWGLSRLSGELAFRLTAAHFDHRLDPGSPRRATQARKLAEILSIPCELGVSSEAPAARLFPDGGLEATARRQRYAFLEDVAARLSADAIATAHHLDDQAETVLLRMQFGSGLQGLSGIQPRLGQRIRPLLALRRRQLVQAMETLCLPTVDDPTNRDLRRPRNLIRHKILPHLRGDAPGLARHLATLAESARRARRRIDEQLDEHLKPEPLFLGQTFAFPRRAMTSLPSSLRPHALTLLARRNGATYPISAEVRLEFLRQLQTGADIGCDCGRGWRLEGDQERIWMQREKPSPGDFAYTLDVPGLVEIASLDLAIGIHREVEVPDVSASHLLTTARIVSLRNSQSVQIRNRRPGDRIWPSGSPRSRRLNDVFTGRRVPRFWRDRLPLLVVDGNIAWVPGVTIDRMFHVEDKVHMDGRVREDHDTLGRASDAWILTLARRPRPTQKSVAVRIPSDDGSKERSKP